MIKENSEAERELVAILIDKAIESELTFEVIYTALQTMKGTKNISPLLALQIAFKDWDL